LLYFDTFLVNLYMRRYIFIILLFGIVCPLYSGLVITRSEVGLETKELYHQNRFAELHNDRIVMIWDFDAFELTLINHALRIYTTIGYDAFREYSERENMARIRNEIDELGEERIEMMQSATATLYSRIRPRYLIADSMLVKGYMAYEYRVFNGNVINQRIWVSRTLQERINREVPRENIQRIENIFKDNRAAFFFVMGIPMDPLSRLVQTIEETGYVVKRIDYGIRERADVEYERAVEEIDNIISDIAEVNIDPIIFTYHQRYQRLDYNAYQMRVIRQMERLLE
jgi:hypothetical protein